MGCTYLSKILAISSNTHTIMLLLILEEFGYPEVKMAIVVASQHNVPVLSNLSKNQNCRW